MEGYRIPFLNIPTQECHLEHKKYSQKEYSMMNMAINKLLRLGAVNRCQPHPEQFLSSIFLADKPNGKKKIYFKSEKS